MASDPRDASVAKGASRSWAADFGSFDGRIWLNTAHQGALPNAAAVELERALAWKRSPHRIPDEAFTDVPQRLRVLLARLVGGRPDEIVLGNSASWGLQVIANGFSWRPGDEVILVEGDYPPTIHPWLLLAEKGVILRRLQPAGPIIQSDELAGHLNDRTRLVCTGWVNTYTGHVLDVVAMARVCAERGTHLILNGTQGIGALPIDAPGSGVSAISASGFKWLCGPYATGFAWIRPDLLAELRPFLSYWLALPEDTALDLNVGAEPQLAEGLGTRAFDIFGTANFFNFMPWIAALEYLLSVGLATIAEHDQRLVEHLRSHIDPARYEWVSSMDPGRRSAIVALDAGEPATNMKAFDRLAAEGIDVALRAGRIRVSPHLYNSIADIDALLTVLHDGR